MTKLEKEDFLEDLKELSEDTEFSEETKKEFSKLREKVLFTEPENLEVTFVEDEIAEIIEKEM